MQCSVVSYLEEFQLNVLLEQASLDDLLGHRVSPSKCYPTFPNKLLGAALRMERRPACCVLFDCTPYGSVAAHDVEMQSGSFVGAYPRYELLAADSTAASFDLLTAMNIFVGCLVNESTISHRLTLDRTNQRTRGAEEL